MKKKLCCVLCICIFRSAKIIISGKETYRTSSFWRFMEKVFVMQDLCISLWAKFSCDVTKVKTCIPVGTHLHRVPTSKTSQSISFISAAAVNRLQAERHWVSTEYSSLHFTIMKQSDSEIIDEGFKPLKKVRERFVRYLLRNPPWSSSALDAYLSCRCAYNVRLHMA